MLNLSKEQPGAKEPFYRDADYWEDSPAHGQKPLEDENAKLKRLSAKTMLDKVVLKDLPEKN